ncbi:hypothetical protein [Novosphingobium terrae]|uniref:hypothetical protein n=1 Tax=Novosphingobium terrae TaxID=2726189 RepID=UPI0019821772|nr:hypothetical protein [Novosphingobium terrae]
MVAPLDHSSLTAPKSRDSKELKQNPSEEGAPPQAVHHSAPARSIVLGVILGAILWLGMIAAAIYFL